jgi:hypothetical protein
MTPILLRKLLIAALVGTIAAAGAGFYFASDFLSKTALETEHVKADAELLTSDLEKLSRLQTEMKDKADIVARAEQIVSDSASFQHQDQVVEDVTAYAKVAGVKISGFSFAGSGASSSSGGGTTAPGAVSIPGVKSIEATVTLQTPIKYTNFLKFLEAIEQNLTKMQVTGVNMTPAADDPNAINNPSVGLSIYVRE